LGDLLFQILFIAHLAEEAGEFTMRDVMEDIAAKMVRRHPHVFGSVKVESVEDVKANWEDIKRNIEKKPGAPAGLLGKIPRSWPALVKAQRITEKASQLRFDWDHIDGVFAKVDEELHELRSAVENGLKQDIAEELGDVLLTVVNLCRFGGVDAEGALNASVGKFTRRFHHMEQRLARQRKSLSDLSAEEMDVLWNDAKKSEGKDP
jgi:tetrapyrrole methylase family protein/MazG family protein